MRERSELARKGIARGRSVVALAYSGGVLFVAENPCASMQKIGELSIAWALPRRASSTNSTICGAAGSSSPTPAATPTDRRDVTGRQLANVYAQTLGTIFTEQAKPYEVELCVAEVAHYGETKPPEMYRITYDGSINDEPHFVVMGGTTEPIATALKESYAENADLHGALAIALEALRAGTADSSNGDQPSLDVAPALRWPFSTPAGRVGHFGGSAAPGWKASCRKWIRMARSPTTIRRTTGLKRCPGPVFRAVMLGPMVLLRMVGQAARGPNA